MSRGGRLVGGLLAAQLVLLGGYLALGRVVETREPEPWFSWEVVDQRAPASLEIGEGVVVVHFWATWCVPCRTELPELLRVAADERARLLAVTDEDRPVIERFFDGRVPSEVTADPGGRARAEYGVSGLPDTFLVRDGRIVGRVGGPRRWDSGGGRRFLRGDPR